MWGLSLCLRLRFLEVEVVVVVLYGENRDGRRNEEDREEGYKVKTFSLRLAIT